MLKRILFAILLLAPFIAHSHKGVITGIVTDPISDLPLVGATVTLQGSVNKGTVTDQFGIYKFSSLNTGKYKVVISYIGYERITLDAEVKNYETTSIQPVLLKTANLNLSEVTINGALNLQGFNSIKSLDIKLRPFQSSQDLLRMVPGLFIAQHAGGGKAEQIFLRGFDIDHGTDINLSVDGMPVNMVSHAHGQGYSDLHFVIPELVENIDFGKGPYYISKGNFTTAGYVGFNTARSVDTSVKLEAGAFGTYRNVNQINLLGRGSRNKKHGAYVATEFLTSRGFFESPQAFRRLNLFGKYHGYIGESSILTVSLSNFTSNWNASGQIPDRAVNSGLITRYGSLDPTEGGKTSRRNINLHFVNDSPLGTFTSQAYYINYNFNLYSNFTFFLNDSINGDQIRQRENRNIFGLRNTLSKEFAIAGKEVLTEAGIGLRQDIVRDIQLSKTKTRSFLEHTQWGDLSELNSNIYFESTVNLSHNFSVNIGIRYDHFVFSHRDKIDNSGAVSVMKGIFSPKVNFNYRINNDFNVYLKTGKGFHSNDTRVVVKTNGSNILPSAYGVDLGTTVKPFKNLILNTALWFLFLEDELVYVGDEGIVEPSGKTRRVGIDISGRYQFTKWLFGDIDLNFSKPRALGAEGEELIPLAPTFTTTGGLTIKSAKGFNGSLRYRHIADRSANEDYSVTAEGYFLIDALVKYSLRNFEFTLAAENILNQKWNEAQFDTESRLREESESVSEIHYTPGTPFFIKAGIAFTIK